MSAVQVTIDDRKFRRAVRRFPEVTFKAARDGFERGLAGHRKEWAPQVRSDRLRAATRWLFVAYTDGTNIGNLEGRMHPRKYHRSLAALDKGRTITPKGKALAIPVPGVRKAGGKGAPKKGFHSPRIYRRRKGRLVTVGNLLHAATKRGKVGRPIFRLRRSVRLRPILFFSSYWKTRKARLAFVERVNKTVSKHFAREFGRRSAP